MPSYEEEQHVNGPTGPGGEWQAGDHFHSFFGCRVLTEKDAQDANKAIAEHKHKVLVGEMFRLPFLATRGCSKCGCTFPAEIYHHEEGDCNPEHGTSEHFDRVCVRCGYTWAESIV